MSATADWILFLARLGGAPELSRDELRAFEAGVIDLTSVRPRWKDRHKRRRRGY